MNRDKNGLDLDNPITTIRVPPTCTCQWGPSPIRGFLAMQYANPKCRLHKVVMRDSEDD